MVHLPNPCLRQNINMAAIFGFDNSDLKFEQCQPHDEKIHPKNSTKYKKLFTVISDQGL